MIQRLLKLAGIGSRVDSVGPGEASMLIKDADTYLLDVRSPQEFRSGHIRGAKLIPVGELRARLAELDAAKGKNILVYCHSGMRSRSAASVLASEGFTV